VTKIVVVDNYDSFTWNLVHLIGPLVAGIEVVRNDAASVDDLWPRAPTPSFSRPAPAPRTKPASVSI
jgi:anthranilate synthase component 2